MHYHHGDVATTWQRRGNKATMMIQDDPIQSLSSMRDWWHGRIPYVRFDLIRFALIRSDAIQCGPIRANSVVVVVVTQAVSCPLHQALVPAGMQPPLLGHEESDIIFRCGGRRGLRQGGREERAKRGKEKTEVRRAHGSGSVTIGGKWARVCRLGPLKGCAVKAFWPSARLPTPPCQRVKT